MAYCPKHANFSKMPLQLPIFSKWLQEDSLVEPKVLKHINSTINGIKGINSKN